MDYLSTQKSQISLCKSQSIREIPVLNVEKPFLSPKGKSAVSKGQNNSARSAQGRAAALNLGTRSGV